MSYFVIMGMSSCALDRTGADGLRPQLTESDSATGSQSEQSPPSLFSANLAHRGSETLQQVPVLVTVPPAMVADASSLHFSVPEQAGALAYEVDQWTGTSAKAWVQLPSLSSVAVNLSVAALPNVQGESALKVWAPQYLNVFHLDENFDTGITSQFSDSVAINLGEPRGATFNADPTMKLTANALQLDGQAGGYLAVNDSADSDIPSDIAKTIEAWFWIRAGSSGDRVIVQKEGDCRGWQVRIRNDGHLQGSLRSGQDCSWFNTYTTSSSVPISEEQWHHVAFVVDQPNLLLHLYVDGELVHTNSTVTALSDSVGGHFHIGASWDGLSNFSGMIDEVRIANGALSADWIRAQFDSMRGALVRP